MSVLENESTCVTEGGGACGSGGEGAFMEAEEEATCRTWGNSKTFQLHVPGGGTGMRSLRPTRLFI